MIYLDNSATTRPFDAVIDAMADAMRTRYFNPSALYSPAVAVEKAVASCREAVAAQVGASADEVVFMASGTEADNLALLGAAAAFREPRTVWLSKLEHPAVLETAALIESMGHRVAYLPVSPKGLVDVAALELLMGTDSGLVSCMQVQNETGAVQPLAALRALLDNKAPDALFHVDGVQGFLRVPFSMREVRADLYSLSAHKIHGPKGVGALVVRKGVKLAPRMFGGGQEKGLRPGTENVPGIVGLEVAIRAFGAWPDVGAKLRAMKLRLYDALLAGIPTIRVLGPDPRSDTAAPHILCVSLPSVRGEVMVHALCEKGVIVSTGAACAAKKRRVSSALAAMGVSAEVAEGVLRMSLSPLNMPEEMDDAARILCECYEIYRQYRRR